MTEASSEQIAEEDRRDVESGLKPASAPGNGTAKPAVEPAATTNGLPDLLSARDPSGPTSPVEETPAIALPANSQILTRWQQIPSPIRRLTLWACAVLIAALLLRAGNAVQPVLLPPPERFAKFAETVKERLPAILYGTDPFGQPMLPVDVNWKILPAPKAGGPLLAELTFEDASFSNIGQVLYTRYKIDYQWIRDHWECHNLRCDVERPELTKLDQMNFNSVLAHESAEKNLELVKLKRAQAEALLKPTLPLGDLLRSSNLY